MGARRAAGPDERGFALLAVLLVVALLGVVGAEFAYSMRLEASAARAYREGIAAAHLAEAGVAQAMRELAHEAAQVGLDPDDGDLVFYTRERIAIPRLPRKNVPLGAGAFSYRLTDEQARINLNNAPVDRVDRLLLALGLEKQERDAVNDAIQDWRDPNDEHRLNGAESDDHYLKLPVPYRARNGSFESVNELLQVKGVTAALFQGTAERPGLADVVTVRTQGQVNVNTAGEIVLRAMRLADAQIIALTQGRRDGPLPTTDLAKLGVTGFVTTSQTFRIEAEGLVAGQSRARVTAIVQKRTAAGGPSIAVLEWSGIR
jgi:general secretion pathway protein K